ncbi:SH3 domain-containing protein [Roseibium sp. M-1]
MAHEKDATAPQFCTVLEDWTATYPDSISVTAGEAIELDGRKDVWDGYTWLWAKNTAGREGWVPDCLVSSDAPVVATEDYSAMELTCKKGDVLITERILHGWAFCRNEADERGWVPARNLSSGC